MGTDGEVVGGGACLAIPPFRATGDNDGEGVANGQCATTGGQRQSKRRRIDYWDAPLPEKLPGDTAYNSDSCWPEKSENESDSYMPRALPDVQGFAAVDLHTDARTRNHYVAAPTVMDARSFIFPVCHDAFLYQRLKEVQASRRAIRRDLVDGALMKIVREEGATIGRWGSVDMWDAVLAGKAGGEEGNREANKKTSTDKPHAQKEATQNLVKKRDLSDGANLVGAGLLDAEVDPSWPGLNSLSRAALW